MGMFLLCLVIKDMWFVDVIKVLLDVKILVVCDIFVYWLVFLLVLVIIGGIYWLLCMWCGLVLVVVCDNIEVVKFVGVDVGCMKWMVFLILVFGIGFVGGFIYM